MFFAARQTRFPLLKDRGVLLKDPGVLLKDSWVLLKDPRVLLKDRWVSREGGATSKAARAPTQRAILRT